MNLLALREWRVIPDYPNYEVSDCGQVRNKTTGRIRRAHIKSVQRPNQKARTCFQIHLIKNGKTLKVHHLVCAAFIGPRPSPAHGVAHGNGDSRDNRADNLRWATGMENEADKKLHGTYRPPPLHVGEKQHNARLTSDDVRQIRQLYAAGQHTQRELAATFGVGRTTVTWVINRRSWAHVE